MYNFWTLNGLANIFHLCDGNTNIALLNQNYKFYLHLRSEKIDVSYQRIIALIHMAGSSQPQHFFAAECIFTDFEAMITDTVSTRTSAGLMAISI